MILKPYLKVLQNHDFTKLWISQITSQLTNYLLSFVILIRVFDLTKSSMAVGVIISAFGLATIFFGSIAGVYSDRFDRKWILTFINFAQAVTVAFFLFFDSYLAMVVIAFFYSALNQFYLPAEAPSIPNLVPKNEILIANSYFASTGSLSLIVGFASAGPLYIFFGANGVYIIAVALLLVAGFATFSLPALSSKKSQFILLKAFEKVWREFKQGAMHFVSNKRLHYPFLSLIVAQMINGIMITIAPAFIEEVIGVRLERNSLLVVGPLGLGILSGALMLGWESLRISKIKQIFLGFMGMGLVISLLSLISLVSEKMLFYAVLSYFIGIFNAHIFSPSHSMLQDNAGESNRGRVYGSLYVALQIAATSPAILVGFLADRISTQNVVWTTGMLMIFLGVLLYTKVLKYSLKKLFLA